MHIRRSGAWAPPPRGQRPRRCGAAPGEPGRVRAGAAPGARPRRADPSVDPGRTQHTRHSRSRERAPGTMTGPEAASDASRPSSGVPDTDGVPVKACGGPAPDSRASRGTVSAGRKPAARFHCRGTLQRAPVPSGRYLNRAGGLRLMSADGLRMSGRRTLPAGARRSSRTAS